MLSDKAKSLLKDVLVVSSLFATLSGAYLGFAVAERYRALTQAHIAQSQEILRVLQAQNAN